MLHVLYVLAIAAPLSMVAVIVFGYGLRALERRRSSARFRSPRRRRGRRRRPSPAAAVVAPPGGSRLSTGEPPSPPRRRLRLRPRRRRRARRWAPDAEVFGAAGVYDAAEVPERPGTAAGRLAAGVAPAAPMRAPAEPRPATPELPWGAPPEWEVPQASKICPDCAESVRLAARICRHCRHRFTDGGSAQTSRAA